MRHRYTFSPPPVSANVEENEVFVRLSGQAVGNYGIRGSRGASLAKTILIDILKVAGGIILAFAFILSWTFAFWPGGFVL